MALATPSSKMMAKRLLRPGPRTVVGPSAVISRSSARVSADVGSAKNLIIEPSIFWSFAQASITAKSFTQYTKTSSIPASLRASCFAR